ncbi:glycosyl hydrolase [Oxalobacteraceae bacterium]|nr:glycosyl hydrolase [Oxalobacteraceae bacterium]
MRLSLARRWRALAMLAAGTALAGCGMFGGKVAGKAAAAPKAPPANSVAKAASSAAAPKAAAAPVAVQAWITSGDRSLLLAKAVDARFGPLELLPQPYAADHFGASPSGPARYGAAEDGAAIIDLDPAQRFQSMLGFGVLLSDTSAWLLQEKLTEPQRKELLAELFAPVPEPAPAAPAPARLQLSLLRVGIGASEFSREHYSLDDQPAGQFDPALAGFSIDMQRPALLPVLKAALAQNPELHLQASAWSAPAWMKEGDSLLKGSLRADAGEVYARYLQRFLDVYRDEGITVHALSLQSAPGSAAPAAAAAAAAPAPAAAAIVQAADFPSMPFDPAARAAFIGTQLGPLLRQHGHATAILEGEYNWDQAGAAQAVLGNPLAAPYIAALAWHCYGGQVTAQETLHAAFPAQGHWISDCSGGQWAPSWRDGLLHIAGKVIVDGARHWARAIVLGNLALDEQGGPHLGGCRNCRGLLTIPLDGGAPLRNVEYYALGHASRFVQPGALRIASNSRQQGVDHVAFANPDGSLVLIAVNPADSPRGIAVRLGNQGFRYRLPGASVATFRWSPGAPIGP